MTSSARQIEKFNPDDAHPKGRAETRDLSPEEIANTLGRGHAKSARVKTRKGMEGERTGHMHLMAHSLRYLKAHEKFGTKVYKTPSMQ